MKEGMIQAQVGTFLPQEPSLIIKRSWSWEDSESDIFNSIPKLLWTLHSHLPPLNLNASLPKIELRSPP